MDLDSILNFIIPAAVLLFGLFYFYKLLQEPIDKFVGFIKNLIGKGVDKGKDQFGRDEDNYYYYPRDQFK